MYVAAKVCEEVVDLANERVKIIQKYKEQVKRKEDKKCSLQYLNSHLKIENNRKLNFKIQFYLHYIHSLKIVLNTLSQ